MLDYARGNACRKGWAGVIFPVNKPDLIKSPLTFVT